MVEVRDLVLARHSILNRLGDDCDDPGNPALIRAYEQKARHSQFPRLTGCFAVECIDELAGEIFLRSPISTETDLEEARNEVPSGVMAISNRRCDVVGRQAARLLTDIKQRSIMQRMVFCPSLNCLDDGFRVRAVQQAGGMRGIIHWPAPTLGCPNTHDAILPPRSQGYRNRGIRA
ncbi:hypothetical protein BHQ19_13190 [Mycolicibacterium porcinum]|nr:hypothetical protein BHQ19_13190 [Mycolicibacterium porcinum]